MANMPLNEAYGDDAMGPVDLGKHGGAASGITLPAGFTTEHGAVLLIAIGFFGLWLVHRVFKGA